MKASLFLLIAIVGEVIGTTFLNLSEGFTHVPSTVLMFIFFAISFTSLTVALKVVPLSIAYSVWAGLGTAGAGIIGVFLFNEHLSAVNIAGLCVIILGVVIMNIQPKNKTENAQ